jgi:hypothetical protein
MRFREFNPILNEFVLGNGQDPFKKLADIASETAETDPLHKEALDIMNMILDKIKKDPEVKGNTSRQPQAQQQVQPQAQQQVQQQTLQQNNPNAVVSERQNTAMPDDLVWEEYLNSIEDPKTRNAMAKDAKLRAITLNFIKKYEQKKIEVHKLITDLASKVLERIAKSKPTESDIEALIGIFKQNQIPDEQMKYFLNGAINGKIINMLTLVKTARGSIDDHVGSSYKKIYLKIIADFFKLADGMRTAGNIGPGEVAFVLLGDPTQKMEKGDLQVGNETFEIKAGNITPTILKDGSPGSPKLSGAVFGAKVNQKPASAWPNVQEILHGIGIEDTTKIGNTTDKTTGEKGTRELQRFKINPTGLKELNYELDYLRIRKQKRAVIMAEILETVFPKQIKKEKQDYIQKVLLTMDEKGHFPPSYDGDLMKLVAKTALAGYRLEKHKENFLFFNKTSRNYMIFRHEQMEEAIDNGTIKLFGGIDWGDGQYPAAPKMVIP